VEASCLAPDGANVIETILSTRASFTRMNYGGKWGLKGGAWHIMQIQSTARLLQFWTSCWRICRQAHALPLSGLMWPLFWLVMPWLTGHHSEHPLLVRFIRRARRLRPPVSTKGRSNRGDLTDCVQSNGVSQSNCSSVMRAVTGVLATKQTMSHWVRDAIAFAYEAHGQVSPTGLRAHSTRGVAS